MTPPHYILGTAGHIDHGKSTLVRALTGVDPDRLPEEKRRGVTIELGFAELELPSGVRMGVVDVPGHERFVRQMVAGASGVDVALLVIAADDGIMVQTREHLAVLRLMGVEHLVVALSKCDLAEPPWRALVRADIEELLAEAGYEGAALVEVSVPSKEGTQPTGLDDLVAALEATTRSIEHTREHTGLRLPVDRVFSLDGVGTVVTGTLHAGTVRSGDEVEVLSSRHGTRLVARVRSVQVYGADVEAAHAGQRTALNLSGIDKAQVNRGDTVAVPGTPCSTRIDVALTYLGVPGADVPLKNRARMHVHHGTSATLGRVRLFGEHLAPGERAFAQIVLDEPLVVQAGDRFIIRSYSPVTTMGGGTVLIADAPPRTTLDEDDRTLLVALEACDHDTIERIRHEREAAHAAHIRETIDRTLRAFHDENPDAPTMPRATLCEQVTSGCDTATFDRILRELAEAGTITIEVGTVRHRDAPTTAQAAQDDLGLRACALLKKQQLAPDATAALAAQLDTTTSALAAALAPLVTQGELTRLAGDLYFTRDALAHGAELLTAHFALNPHPAPAAELRDVLGVSRKYAIPLLEHYDAIALTKRDTKNARILNKT